MTRRQSSYVDAIKNIASLTLPTPRIEECIFLIITPRTIIVSKYLAFGCFHLEDSHSNTTPEKNYLEKEHKNYRR